MSQFNSGYGYPYGGGMGLPMYVPPWQQMFGPIQNQANMQANESSLNAAPKKKKAGWLWNLFGRPGWMAEFSPVQSANSSPMGRAGIGKGAAPAYASDMPINNPLKQNDRLFGLRSRPIIRGMDQFLGGYGSKKFVG